MNMTMQLPEAEAVKAEVLNKYPAKVAKKRSKSMVVNDPEAPPPVQANVRTIPGIITQRGCCYAGCKGVVLGHYGGRFGRLGGSHGKGDHRRQSDG